MEVTLDMLLASRDDRHATQLKLLSENTNKSLVCVTIVMPGRVKRNSYSLAIAHEAIKELSKKFGNAALERDLQTGYEAYFLTPLLPIEAKKATCEIEEMHPLGRLFDIDVIGKDGIPVSRKDIGKGERKCLMCDKDARYCMRNHTHSQEEILLHIQKMIDSLCTTSMK